MSLVNGIQYYLIYLYIVSLYSKKKIMRQFLKFVLATLVALFVFIFLSIVIIIWMVPKPKGIADIAVLKIDLNKKIIERESDDLWGTLKPSFTGEEGTMGLLELREAIKKAKEDNKIK